jgi:hypothetical protein
MNADADLLDDDFDDPAPRHSTSAPAFVVQPLQRASHTGDSNSARHHHGQNANPSHSLSHHAAAPATVPTVRQETLNKLEQFRKRNLGI